MSSQRKRRHEQRLEEFEMSDEEDVELYVPLKERRRLELEKREKSLKRKTEPPPQVETVQSASQTSLVEKEKHEDVPIGLKTNVSLLDQHSELKKIAEAEKETDYEKQLKEEEKILDSIAEKKVLMAVGEIAKGIVYTDSIKTGWRPPRYFKSYPPEKFEKIRKKWHILVEGEDIPPPVKTFKEMKFPRAVLNTLK